MSTTFDIFRRNPNISLEHGTCGIGFLHTVGDVSVPLEVTRHCVSKLLGMVDQLKFVSMEGV